MLKDFRISLARRRIARRQRHRGLLEFLASWLPIWCFLALLLVLTQYFGDMILLIVPVWVLGRYFMARRRSDLIIQKLYTIIRLNHPLPENLLSMAQCDSGAVGVRLQMVAELLQRGVPLAEALRLAMPELPAAQYARIAEADAAGRLLQELAVQSTRSNPWPVTSELDGNYWLFMMATLCVFVVAFMGFSVLVLPKLQKMSHAWHTPFADNWFPHLVSVGSKPPHWLSIPLIMAGVVVLVAAGAVLRRLVLPFFRVGTVSIYIRDALAWWLPILGSLIRCRTWSDASRVLSQGVSAGRPLPEVAENAAMAVGSRVAQYRLKRWRRKILAGMPAEKAASKCMLPATVCNALGQPTGSTASALAVVSGYYDIKYRRRLEWIRAVSIPIVVLCMGALVLLFCLALYGPYIQILQAAGGGGG